MSENDERTGPGRPSMPGHPRAPRGPTGRSPRSIALAAAMALLATTLVLIGAGPVSAAEATVTSEAELRAAWADPDQTTITLEADIELTECTTPVRDTSEPVEVVGGGHTLDQGCAPTALEAAGSGEVVVRDLTVLGPISGGGETTEVDPSLVFHGRTDLLRVEVEGAAGAGVLTFAHLYLEDTVVRRGGSAGVQTLGNGFEVAPLVDCTRCRIEGNGGHGIDASGGAAKVVLDRATIDDNSWNGVEAIGDVHIESSTITYNDIAVRSTGDVTVTNSTITYNGAGVVVEADPVVVLGEPREDDPPEIRLLHATVVANEDVNVSAPVIRPDRTVLGSNVGVNCVGEVESGGWTFSDDGSCSLDGEGDIEDPFAVPGLADLADNGGPTLTRYPLDDSPLVGAVPNDRCGVPSLDQRGFSRPPAPGAPCDIGAVQSGHPQCASTFVDVGADHPFCIEIAWLADEEGAKGWPDGTYRPGVPASRQALAAFLWRLWGQPDPLPGAPTFTDVPSTHPFHDAIIWLAGEGFAEGYDDGTFRPTDPVSRQAAAALLRRQHEGGRSGGVPAVRDATFPDVPDGHPFHDDIAWLVDGGIADGYDDGTFRPGAPVSRQAMAAFLYRLYGIRT